MSELILNVAQFPDAIGSDPTLGDRVYLSISGRIIRMEVDPIDVTPLGGKPEYVPGAQRIAILIDEAMSA